MFDYALEPWVRIDGGYTVQGQSIYFDRYTFELCDQGEGTIRMRDPSGGGGPPDIQIAVNSRLYFSMADLMGTSGFDPSPFGGSSRGVFTVMMLLLALSCSTLRLRKRRICSSASSSEH